MSEQINKKRSLIVTLGAPHDLPWWWEHIQQDQGLCSVDYERMSFSNKNSLIIKTHELPLLAWKVLKSLKRWRKEYDYIYTFECDLLGFFISFWQTLLWWKKPKHVIVQFIMREKTQSLSSQLKYLVMKFCFSSLYKAICSSSHEAAYYRKTFDWPQSKAAYAPFHSDPKLLTMPTSDEDFVMAGGRTFRDYKTLFESLKGTDIQCTIVGMKPSECYDNNQNIHIKERLPVKEFETLLSKSSIVVIPLFDQKISTGQSVLLQAMALAKPVIITRTNGTVEYVEDGVNAFLVDPSSPQQLNEIILKLMNNPELRESVGRNAKAAVEDMYLPHHYTKNVREIVMG